MEDVFVVLFNLGISGGSGKMGGCFGISVA